MRSRSATTTHLEDHVNVPKSNDDDKRNGTRQLDGIEAELLRDEASLSRLDRLIQKAEVAP